MCIIHNLPRKSWTPTYIYSSLLEFSSSWRMFWIASRWWLPPMTSSLQLSNWSLEKDWWSLTPDTMAIRGFPKERGLKSNSRSNVFTNNSSKSRSLYSSLRHTDLKWVLEMSLQKKKIYNHINFCASFFWDYSMQYTMCPYTYKQSKSMSSLPVTHTHINMLSWCIVSQSPIHI